MELYTETLLEVKWLVASCLSQLESQNYFTKVKFTKPTNTLFKQEWSLLLLLAETTGLPFYQQA